MNIISILFLCFFLPIFILVYYVIPHKYKNNWLLFSSLLFLIIGKENLIWYFLFTTFISYFGMKFLSQLPKNISKKKILTFIILLEIIVWFFFILEYKSKIWIYPICYGVILLSNIASILDYYKNRNPIPSLLSYLTYASCFPRLLIGPISSYFDIKKELEIRKITKDNFIEGTFTFLNGILIQVFLISPLIFFKTKLMTISNSLMSSWFLLIVTALLMLLFMKSYSYIAIGLGKLIGFSWKKENSYPIYLSKLQQFFGSWHASLVRWWNQYMNIKIPFGLELIIFSLFISFIYGINFSIILFFFSICLGILIEEKWIKSLSKRRLYWIHGLWILFSFIFLIEPNLSMISIRFSNLFNIFSYPIMTTELLYLLKEYIVILVISIGIITPIFKVLKKKIKNIHYSNYIFKIGYIFLLLFLFLYLIHGIETDIWSILV